MAFYGFRDYVPVAQRRLRALKEAEKLKKRGRVVSPVTIEGRKIAASFWGKAWCDNLERYSDFETRLPRGRTYLRNGSVIDLQIGRGKVEALVSGTEIYKVKVEIAVAAPTRWTGICQDCAGSVGSLIELLQGKLSKNVMERVCREADGLFPTPSEIRMSCSCPDWAGMCKHVAATLYGVGARLDSDPDLLFTLRGVDRAELVSVGADLPLTRAAAASERVLADDDVAALFGIEIAAPDASPLGQSREEKRQAREPAGAAGPEKPKAGAAHANALAAQRQPKHSTKATSGPVATAPGRAAKSMSAAKSKATAGAARATPVVKPPAVNRQS
jgi:uncharacterized Zn finger protein